MNLRMLMLWNLAVLMTALCLYGCGAVQTTGEEKREEDTLVILPQWRKGEKHHYEIVKKNKRAYRRTYGMVETPEIVSRTDFEIEVLAVSEDGFTVRLSFEEARFDDPRMAENPYLKAMGNMMNDFPAILEIDSTGAITGVQNWKELTEICPKLLDNMTEMLKATKIDDSEIAKISELVSTMFATKEQIEWVYTRETRALFMPLGVELKAGEPLEFDDLLPNPFGGGEAVPSLAKVTLQSMDQDSGRAVVHWRRTIDPEKGTRVLERTLRDIAQRMDQPIPEDFEFAITIEDFAEYAIDAFTGWVLEGTHTQTTITRGETRTETATITRIEK